MAEPAAVPHVLTSLVWPAFIWAFAQAGASIAAWRKAEIESWRRLQELAQILHAGPEKGSSAQLMAIGELRTHWRRRAAARTLLGEAIAVWETQPSPPADLIRTGTAVLRSMGGR